MSHRRAFALLAGVLAVLLGVAVGIGTGREARREPTPPPPSPAHEASEGDEGNEAGDTDAPGEASQADDTPARPVWVGTWSAAPSGPEPGTRDGLPGHSLRNVVRTSIGGERTRVELSNRYGTAPVTFTDATVALSARGGPDARPETLRALTFDGRGSVTVPPGGSVVSDPAALAVPPAADLLVSFHTPDPSGPVTHHRLAQQTSWAAAGNHAASASGAAFTEPFASWRYVTGVHVLTDVAEGAVVVLGDSLTDGALSTPGANRRWTDALATRLRDEPGAPALGVLNLGISGNRLLRDALPDRSFNGAAGLRRLPDDALAAPGAGTLVIQLGINDILFEPRDDPDAVIAGLRTAAERGHAAGLRVVGATLGPFGGHAEDDPGRERVRQRVNAAIRDGGMFDAVIDFDRALRDPAAPARLLPRYDSGDGLHPNDAGYAAMADAVDPRALLPTPRDGLGPSNG
ncbi:SGNH/GDSL hydrolase family protein [Streptomyces radicis]|uniref:SGNH/GDSL hydrolase family protein n=1 Tax=Streptomyces radicis TaxID=1750517 RepID=A0A3A9W673_9ACTN|nr:SGNH/GDSL hydrolase family protein [Streptomyces radicis]RKN20777.1 SGNH/GDSL hydrolase family protein [Streptomyces radicis]